jgi:hypothetical protein
MVVRPVSSHLVVGLGGGIVGFLAALEYVQLVSCG